MPSSDDDHTPRAPSYDFDNCLPSPTYSVCIGSTERLLRLEQPGITGCPAYDWMSETKHMKINLGSRVWGLHTPSYGLRGKVEGSIRFSGDQNRIERVTVMLVGYLTTTFAHLGRFYGESVMPIVSNTVELYSASNNASFGWDQDHSFSIPIPSTVSIRGQTTPTPPSFSSTHQRVTHEISYALKFCMTRTLKLYRTRKSRGLTKNETTTIKILYLPKSSPSSPPLAAIPMPVALEHCASLLTMYERVKTITLVPHRPIRCKRASLECFDLAVHLSLPNPLSFTSGELIPFTLSLIFPNEPVLAGLLAQDTQIHLFKRFIIHKKGVGGPLERDTLVSSAQLHTFKEYAEGISMLRGVIQAGTAGGENSWEIEDVMGVQYVLRAVLRPPGKLVDHIPTFSHEEILHITTDYWGTPDRELNSVGGTPTPALGLAKGAGFGNNYIVGVTANIFKRLSRFL